MKYGFSLDKLKVETGDGEYFTLIEPFTFTKKDGTIITVPKGTTSDGASTPRILWRIIPPFGKYWKAAFLHDYLYRDSDFKKDFCDNVFLEAMEGLGVTEAEAHTIYEGVHLFGASAFNEDREKREGKQENDMWGNFWSKVKSVFGFGAKTVKETAPLVAAGAMIAGGKDSRQIAAAANQATLIASAASLALEQHEASKKTHTDNIAALSTIARAVGQSGTLDPETSVKVTDIASMVQEATEPNKAQ